MLLKPTIFNFNQPLFDDSDSYDSIDDYNICDNYDSYDNSVNKAQFDSMKAQFDVDAAMNQAYERNKHKINSESIRPIGDDIFAYYNSLNILVGNQGKGKSHIVIRDLIQICRLPNTNIHLIVYISKSGTINDSTLESQQELIKLPIQAIADGDREKYLKKLDLKKDLNSKYWDEVDGI